MRKMIIGTVLTLCAAILVGHATPAEARARRSNPSLKWGVVRGTLSVCAEGEVAGTLVYLEGTSSMAKVGPEGTYALYFVPVGVYTLVIEHQGTIVDVIPDVEVEKWEYTDIEPVEICDTPAADVDG